MARPGNRRRRASHPSSVGAFHPQDRSPASDHHRREGNLMDSPSSASDLRSGNGDRPSAGLVRCASASDGSDRRLDPGDRQASGLLSDGGEQRLGNGADHHRQRRFDGSEKGRKDGSEHRGHASGAGHHRRSLSRDRPPYYHHYQKNQRWEGKENSDQKKDSASVEAGKTQEYTPYMASRAKDLKEEGNRRFQRKDFLGAMDQYELALKLTPANHPDRAVFHSNRAACLMQMKPPHHDAAIHECNLALEVQASFPRALLRRARAYEAIGKLELALQDVELLLKGDVSHPDALDMAKRIRLSMGHQGDDGGQGLRTPPPYSRSKSYAGASAVASSDVPAALPASRSFNAHNVSNGNFVSAHCNPAAPSQTSGILATNKPFREMQSPPQVSSQPMHSSWPVQMHPSLPSSNMTTLPNEPSAPRTPPMDSSRLDSSEKIIHQDSSQSICCDNSPISSTATLCMRPLKLIYDHDIRLAEMPVNCKFGDLRKLVKSKFPSSKAILMKYKDVEGDLVTITSTEELRLAEAAAAVDSARRNLRASNISPDGCVSQERRLNSAIGLPVVPSVLDQLRLHVVEVPTEQEPHDKENPVNLSAQNATDSDFGMERTQPSTPKERCFDKWLLEFANLFRTHLGIDPSGHVNFHHLGLELCAEALEETITTEEAHKLFEQAGCKFQEMIAVGFLNWGNVYMCSARKEVPSDNEDNHQIDFCERLQAVFDWAHAQYALAEEKFQLSLKVKPDFCDGILALGHKDFESAKLNWALAVASQKDLKAWEPSQTLQLFCSAAGHAKKAAELMAEQEEAHVEEGGALHQDANLKSQIYIFWGNVLYEHSQVEFRLGLQSWNELLNDAVHKFEVAGVSLSDISMALHKHLSSSHTFVDVREESAAKDSGVLESESFDEKKEWKDAPQDHDNQQIMQIGLLDNESVPLSSSTECGELILAESHCDKYDHVDGFSECAKNMQGESCDGEHVPVDNVADDADMDYVAENANTDNVQQEVPYENGFLEVSMVTS